jgi:hypothetical protein
VRAELKAADLVALPQEKKTSSIAILLKKLA